LSAELSPEALTDLYRTMVRIRAFEEQVHTLHMAGLIPGLVHLYSGQEAVAGGVMAALGKDDVIASHHRGHGHCVAKGSDLERMFAELLGRKAGYGLGRGGSMHIHDPATHNLGTNGIVGGSVPLATGAALTSKLKKAGWVAVSFFGDGVLNGGILFESMNMAAIWSLPAIYVCENNGYGEFTEIDAVTAGRPYSARASAFGIPVETVDGMDSLAVHAAAATAVARARGGKGPTFILCNTYRYSGHHVGDKQEYKDDAERKSWLARDPIARLGRHLVDSRKATADGLKKLETETRAAVQAAAERAKKLPESGSDDLMAFIYAE
jgi:TPP-dependent pyruvate/acetoin dehydrogenase alpha subunit